MTNNDMTQAQLEALHDESLAQIAEEAKKQAWVAERTEIARLAILDRTGLDITHHDMSHQDLSRLDLSGANLSNICFDGCSFDETDLSQTDLHGSQFVWATFIGANMQGAFCREADFSDANLTNANLSYVDFSKALFSATRFDGANMTGATIQHTYIDGCSLKGTILTKADLWDCSFDDTILASEPASFEAIFKPMLYHDFKQFPEIVPGIQETLRAGRIDGKHYLGECACLRGTESKLLGYSDPHDLVQKYGLQVTLDHPLEMLFNLIYKGDTPENSPLVALIDTWITQWREQHSRQAQTL